MAIEIISFRAHSKNTLEGFATVRMTQIGLEIRDITVHSKDGKRWLGLPAKPYKKPDGSDGWSYIIDFYDRETADKFRDATLKALDAYRSDQ